MNVEIGADAALFPEKEYISGIFVAVWIHLEGLIWSSDLCDYSGDEFCQVESGDERGEINCRIECREGASSQHSTTL